MMHHQSAVVPWRRQNGSIEILIITSRTTGQWSIPKGWIEDGLTPQASASQEAFEEAGVRGKVGPEVIGSYEYNKHGQNFSVDVYPLEVIMILDQWPEKEQRRRRWVPLADIETFVKDSSLLQAIKGVECAPSR